VSGVAVIVHSFCMGNQENEVDEDFLSFISEKKEAGVAT
jgi:hypothetical protein